MTAPRTLIALIVTLGFLAPAAAEDRLGVDDTVCDFVLPGSFEKAREKAKASGRCLLIKGVAFGMDKLGATDCTKGHW